MNPYGRISSCGAICSYNSTEKIKGTSRSKLLRHLWYHTSFFFWLNQAFCVNKKGWIEYEFWIWIRLLVSDEFKCEFLNLNKFEFKFCKVIEFESKNQKNMNDPNLTLSVYYLYPFNRRISSVLTTTFSRVVTVDTNAVFQIFWTYKSIGLEPVSSEFWRPIISRFICSATTARLLVTLSACVRSKWKGITYFLSRCDKKCTK